MNKSYAPRIPISQGEMRFIGKDRMYVLRHRTSGKYLAYGKSFISLTRCKDPDGGRVIFYISFPTAGELNLLKNRLPQGTKLRDYEIVERIDENFTRTTILPRRKKGGK